MFEGERGDGAGKWVGVTHEKALVNKVHLLVNTFFVRWLSPSRLRQSPQRFITAASGLLMIGVSGLRLSVGGLCAAVESTVCDCNLAPGATGGLSASVDRCKRSSRADELPVAPWWELP